MTFEMDQSRYDEVVRLVQGREPRVTEDEVHNWIFYDWSNADEHQEWLNSAPLTEIAGWVDTDVILEQRQQDA